MAANGPKTFVLVHGAWHGGWCWSRVAAVLRARGHIVTTPTQTGLGERSHLLSGDVTMDVFVDDVVNHLVWNDLRDVVLVPHSFAGCSVTGAADRVPERIGLLIYLDAAIMEDGETWFSLLPPDMAEDRRKLAEVSSGGVSLPVGSMESLGVTKPEDLAFVEARLTPHPFATFTTPVTLDHPAGNGLPAHYITCTDPVYRPAQGALARAQERGWPVHELRSGHDAMVIAPEATADLLEAVAFMESGD